MFSRKTIAAAFPVTIPVLMGYLAIGLAFGLMLQSAGYGVLWAFLTFSMAARIISSFCTPRPSSENPQT